MTLIRGKKGKKKKKRENTNKSKKKKKKKIKARTLEQHENFYLCTTIVSTPLTTPDFVIENI